ncbi:glutathione S-transferase family protein [Massilia sp. BJB1822]|uniref:glutathione S-transferase family protein n=1 Tax=Massilia sp. BJB1822 TaxID=2744470 RepID=UPI0015939567|nr:glutathione S-transferase family protein [Massilia sp. BJB1822]NVE00783.1 glutathione S-transferase family protein [Massilia sp. BJB1822]
MRLYHHPVSSNARRVLLTIAQLGIQVDSVELNLMDAEDRRRLGEVNPNSKVPVLEDEGWLLWESCAIMQYLADKTPGQTLYPQDLKARADINRWLFWAAQHFSPAIGVFTWERVWKPLVTGGTADPAELKRGGEDLEQFATVLNQHLADREWLCGNGLTLADFAVAAPLMYRERAQLPIDNFPHLLAWFGRVQQLPAWKHTEHVW